MLSRASAVTDLVDVTEGVGGVGEMLESCCSRRGILETKDANIRSAPFSFDRLLKFLYPCSCDGFSIITADSISLSFFFAYSFYKKVKLN